MDSCQDLLSQNTILHQHLESVSTQAARIRQVADSSSQPEDGENASDTDGKLSELRSVVAYLRKEKEIVDLQLELSKQENARLKAQIEHLSQTLDDTRNTLSEVIRKSDLDDRSRTHLIESPGTGTSGGDSRICCTTC